MLQSQSSDRSLFKTAYRQFALSRVFSSLGFQSTSVGIAWLIYDRTHSAYALGLAGLTQFLPMLLLTFVVGHVADRFDRRRVVLACQLVEAAVTLTLAVTGLTGHLTPVGIFAGIALLGTAQAFERPTMSALLTSVVPDTMLPKAIATTTSMMQTALIAGPALGGLLYGVAPVVPFFASCLLFVVASLAVSRLPAHRPSESKPPVSLDAIFAGVAFIRANPVILGAISLDLFAVLFGGATALLPIYARDILQTGPFGLGLLRASPAIGATMMSLWLAAHPLTQGAGRKMFLAVTIFGLATIVFALSTTIWLSVGALLVVGASDTVSVVVRSSVVQLMTPDAMRGRVNAVNSLFIGTSNQLGEFESGMVAGLIGPVAAAVVGGLGTLAVVGLWMKLFPALRQAEIRSGT